MINHILLEIYCHKKIGSTVLETDTIYSEKCDCAPKYECLLNGCPFLSFTSHEDALCYINSNSEVGSIVSFGGEMVSECSNESTARLLWQKVAMEKIEEAYVEYMKKIHTVTE